MWTRVSNRCVGYVFQRSSPHSRVQNEQWHRLNDDALDINASQMNIGMPSRLLLSPRDLELIMTMIDIRHGQHHAAQLPKSPLEDFHIDPWWSKHFNRWRVGVSRTAQTPAFNCAAVIMAHLYFLKSSYLCPHDTRSETTRDYALPTGRSGDKHGRGRWKRHHHHPYHHHHHHQSRKLKTMDKKGNRQRPTIGTWGGVTYKDLWNEFGGLCLLCVDPWWKFIAKKIHFVSNTNS